jgi:hypothetical protein
MTMDRSLGGFQRIDRLGRVPDSAGSGVRAAAYGAFTRIDKMLCGLMGHVEVRRFERGRVSLSCLRCGHQSAGWQLSSTHVGVVRRDMFALATVPGTG